MYVREAGSPTRLLAMLSDRFGGFEAIANSSIKFARVAPEEELAINVLAAARDPEPLHPEQRPVL